MNVTTNAPTQLFDLKQREDGAWVVWTRRSRAELGLVNREEIEATRREQFTDEEWVEFLKQPHFVEQTTWVIAETYQSRPTVDTVLALLGVKRRPKTAATPVRQNRRPTPAKTAEAV